MLSTIAIMAIACLMMCNMFMMRNIFECKKA